jgi:hypothetical protein
MEGLIAARNCRKLHFASQPFRVREGCGVYQYGGVVMARKKQRDDNDDRDVDEPEEDAVPDDAADEDEPPLEDEPADEDAAPADEPPKDDEEEEKDVELPPRPRTPVFTIVLLILNLLVAPPFFILLVMDYSSRQQWSYATFLNWAATLGLPLADEEDAAPAAFYNRPRLRIDGDKLKDAYNKRPHPGAPSFSEPYVPVDTIDQPVTFRIRPSQIDDRVKRDLFQSVGEPVGTLDAEVQRLKAKVPSAIEEAATKYVADQGTVEKKKAAAERILLPMAWSTALVDRLQQRIDEASKDPAQLDALLKDAVQRRMLTDVLAPLNIYRPDEGATMADLPDRAKDPEDKGAYEKFAIEKVANIDDYKLEKLQELLQKRFDDALRGKDDIDKRHQIAFLMVTLARLKAPDATEPLLPKHFERSQIVCGLFEFTQAAANYPRTLQVLRQRVLDAIAVDREGYIANAKDPITFGGFIDQLAAEIERLRKVKVDIDWTQKRTKYLETQRDRYEKEYNDRLALVTELTKKLVEARGKTAEERVKVNQLQQELFDAQTYLSDAAARNAELLEQIDAAEKKLLPKGVKK